MKTIPPSSHEIALLKLASLNPLTLPPRLKSLVAPPKRYGDGNIESAAPQAKFEETTALGSTGVASVPDPEPEWTYPSFQAPEILEEFAAPGLEEASLEEDSSVAQGPLPSALEELPVRDRHPDDIAFLERLKGTPTDPHQVLLTQVMMAMGLGAKAQTDLLRLEIERIREEQGYLERSRVSLEDTLKKAQAVNPEGMALLRTENARHQLEIARLQSELETARRTNAVSAQRAGSRWWRCFAFDLEGPLSKLQDLRDTHAALLETPELAPFAAGLSELTAVLSDYQDQGLSFAHSFEGGAG